VPQTQRRTCCQKFQRGELPVLVATDVAARGLHIPEVSHVFNYDLPQDAEDYVAPHRSHARLGASGDAISFRLRAVRISSGNRGLYGHKIPVVPITEAMLAKPNRQ